MTLNDDGEQRGATSAVFKVSVSAVHELKERGENIFFTTLDF
jgi:hypothetical protein